MIVAPLHGDRTTSDPGQAPSSTVSVSRRWKESIRRCRSPGLHFHGFAASASFWNWHRYFRVSFTPAVITVSVPEGLPSTPAPAASRFAVEPLQSHPSHPRPRRRSQEGSSEATRSRTNCGVPARSLQLHFRSGHNLYQASVTRVEESGLRFGAASSPPTATVTGTFTLSVSTFCNSIRTSFTMTPL